MDMFLDLFYFLSKTTVAIVVFFLLKDVVSVVITISSIFESVHLLKTYCKICCSCNLNALMHFQKMKLIYSHEWFLYVVWGMQAWILASSIGKCPAKTYVRLMSDENCFTTETVVRREVKNFFIRYRGRGNHIGISCSGVSFHKHFNRHFIYAVFIFKTIRCVYQLIKIFFTNTFVIFCPAWNSFSSENICIVSKI